MSNFRDTGRRTWERRLCFIGLIYSPKRPVTTPDPSPRRRRTSPLGGTRPVDTLRYYTPGVCPAALQHFGGLLSFIKLTSRRRRARCTRCTKPRGRPARLSG
ncbi:hypothetical protein EVAR_43783_1 [Eumeta japonica]|uniref:Uncharacterized protein n=1 Tax=Eumeta variegata TaxID=151549 RepID=A0A4C1XW40_EUMVA|nr:hypothetical protein EVAR_43783_1 [Eumeta japonica]